VSPARQQTLKVCIPRFARLRDVRLGKSAGGACYSQSTGAWAHSAVRDAPFPASAAAAGRVVAPVAVSVAGDVARPAAFSHHLHSAAIFSDDPVPSSAGVFGDPDPVFRITTLPRAGISGAASCRQCSDRPAVHGLEDHLGEIHFRGGGHCCCY
jgi:hypothetical protein